MVEKESREAFAENDETQSQLNIKLERGLQAGWGAERGGDARVGEREILIAIIWPADPREMTRSPQAASNTDI